MLNTTIEELQFIYWYSDQEFASESIFLAQENLQEIELTKEYND